MVKIIGYLLGAIGLVGVAAYSVPELQKMISLPSQVNDTMLLIVSLALLIFAALLITRSGGSKQAVEVPIFKGKNVVGYRRQR
jgi:hypothetical protein